MKAEGIENPNDEEVRRFDRKRKKKTSNKEHIPPTGMAYTATRDGMAKWGFLNGLLGPKAGIAFVVRCCTCRVTRARNGEIADEKSPFAFS
jgi:hypothetical protein